jgi:hypothetical protein
MTECNREPEILDAVASGHWPDDLRDHADRCSVCADLSVVVTLLREEHREASSAARLPTAGQVWWRATMRRRAEAAAAAARPITMLQGLAGACAAGVFAALITLWWPSFERPVAWMASTLTRESTRVEAVGPLTTTVPFAIVSLVVIAAAGLILTPLIFYFVLSDE